MTQLKIKIKIKNFNRLTPLENTNLCLLITLSMCEIDKGTLGQPFLCIACLLLVVNNIYLQIFHSKS